MPAHPSVRPRSRPWLIAALFLCLGALPARGAPYVPRSDAEVLEELPYRAGDPLTARLRAERAQLARRPDDTRLAVHLAREYLEVGRESGDPRYAGYAQAALMRWWDLPAPPREVLLLRAILHQRVHEFAPALEDLTRLLAADPRDAQAHLTRATVLGVLGSYAAAAADCRALNELTEPLIATTCLSAVAGASGELAPARARLAAALAASAPADPGLREWALTTLAELDERAGEVAAAEAHFRAALALDAADPYLLGAWGDFLLRQGRAADVLPLLSGLRRSDPLLLRTALAEKALGVGSWRASAAELRARIAASRERGDRVHLREEARDALELEGDARAALALARENFAVQKEPADVLILAASARAAHDERALERVRGWLASSRLEDARLARVLAPGTP
jgi:Tfp pilus assembly protein PilF